MKSRFVKGVHIFVRVPDATSSFIFGVYFHGIFYIYVVITIANYQLTIDIKMLVHFIEL